MKDWLESLFIMFAVLVFFTLIVAFGVGCLMGMTKLLFMLWSLLF